MPRHQWTWTIALTKVSSYPNKIWRTFKMSREMKAEKNMWKAYSIALKRGPAASTISSGLTHKVKLNHRLSMSQSKRNRKHYKIHQGICHGWKLKYLNSRVPTPRHRDPIKHQELSLQKDQIRQHRWRLRWHTRWWTTMNHR